MNRNQPDTSLPKTKIYRNYVALLSQLGTDPPTATIIFNNLEEGDPVWSRLNTGLYTATLTNAFPRDKTVIFITSTSDKLVEAYNQENGEPSSNIDVRTTGDDGYLYLTSIEIRVYS